ncbi:hypothetical protein HAX54_044976, partial [Datura stramonium]|nr:hypothetical protein [Datura stramonium]
MTKAQQAKVVRLEEQAQLADADQLAYNDAIVEHEGMFNGFSGEDPNQHLINFTAICNAYRMPRVSQKTINWGSLTRGMGKIKKKLKQCPNYKLQEEVLLE